MEVFALALEVAARLEEKDMGHFLRSGMSNTQAKRLHMKMLEAHCIVKRATVGEQPQLNNMAGFTDLDTVSMDSAQRCSNPRDKIYGLTALFGGVRAYPVDYSSTTQAVYAKFALHVIESTGSLDTLSCRNCSVAIEDPRSIAQEIEFQWLQNLPSWCPDWSAPGYVARSLRKNTLRDVRKSNWFASGDTKIKRTATSSTTLGLFGKIISRIAFKSNFGERNFGEEAAWRLISTQSSLSVLHAYVDVLYPLSDNLPEISRRLGIEWIAYFAPTLFTKAGYQMPTDNIAARKSMVAKNMERIKTLNVKAALFTTDNHYLGSGLNGLKTGDLLCALYGGKTLYVVRPVDDGKHHTLISDAYVPGLMDGKALELGLPYQESLLV